MIDCKWIVAELVIRFKFKGIGVVDTDIIRQVGRFQIFFEKNKLRVGRIAFEIDNWDDIIDLELNFISLVSNLYI